MSPADLRQEGSGIRFWGLHSRITNEFVARTLRSHIRTSFVRTFRCTRLTVSRGLRPRVDGASVPDCGAKSTLTRHTGKFLRLTRREHPIETADRSALTGGPINTVSVAMVSFNIFKRKTQNLTFGVDLLD